MHAYSRFTIDLTATESDIKKLTVLLAEELDDQDCFEDYEDFDDFDDDFEEEDEMEEECDPGEPREAFFEIEDCFACVWLEDIQTLAARMAKMAPASSFALIGTVDVSESSGECMDFEIEYENSKLISRSSCWYIDLGEDHFKLDSGTGPVVTDVPLDDPEEIDIDSYLEDDENSEDED